MNEQPHFYSQFGEDQILDEIFQDKTDGYCVEVGGHDGITGSTTFFFEKKGWTCLLVEPIPEYCEKIKRNRQCIVQNYAASTEDGEASFFIAEKVEGMSTLNLTQKHRQHILKEGGGLKEMRVKTKTLNHILEECHFPKIDFISIDVEGHEMAVLKGFSLETWRPRIILLEDNSNLIDPSVLHYMQEKGYVNFKRTGVNDWYAYHDDLELIQPSALLKFEQERKKARFENRLVQNVQFLTPYIPKATKPFFRKIIKWLASLSIYT